LSASANVPCVRGVRRCSSETSIRTTATCAKAIGTMKAGVWTVMSPAVPGASRRARRIRRREPGADRTSITARSARRAGGTRPHVPRRFALSCRTARAVVTHLTSTLWKLSRRPRRLAPVRCALSASSSSCAWSWQYRSFSRSSGAGRHPAALWSPSSALIQASLHRHRRAEVRTLSRRRKRRAAPRSLLDRARSSENG